MNTKEKKPLVKKWWFWALIIVVLIGVAGAAGNNSTNMPIDNSATTKEAETPKPQEKPKWDVEEVYANIKDGMTKAEVEKAISKTSDNCSESSSEYIGKTELCTYGSLGDNGSITVTFQNDKVSSKAKSKF